MGELNMLGKVGILVEPKKDNPDVFEVRVTAETRDETITGVTKDGETVDQLILRLKGMMKALYNAPLKKQLQEAEAEKKRKEMIGQMTGKQ